jgi:hypothetical protein
MKERTLPELERNQICPPADQSILEFYKGYYESAYIILHPFFEVINPEKIDFDKEEYPTKSEITKHCKIITWKEFMDLSKIENISKLDIALRNSIKGLKESHKDETTLSKLIETCEKHHVHQPNEGSFEELLIDPMLKGISNLGYKWIFRGDEFGTERQIMFIDDIINNNEKIGDWYKNIYTPKNEILFSVHWDSHFTLICSSKSTIEQIIEHVQLEGFYCDHRTEIYWSCQ